MVKWKDVELIKVSETPFLYHYQRYDVSWIEGLLKRKEIYFATPGQLNDPWDCRVCYDETCVDEPEEHQRQVNYFKQAALSQGRKPIDVEELGKEWLADRDIVKRAIKKSSDDVTQAISEQYRIYCLTKDPAHILMWGHYANSHRGVCLEFSTENNIFSSAMKVLYSKDYPQHNFANESENILPLFVKADVWGYEAEYRIVAEEGVGKSTETLKTKNNFLTIPDGALKSIIVGVSMPSKQRQEIQDLIKASNSNILVKEAVIPNRYEIIIS